MKTLEETITEMERRITKAKDLQNSIQDFSKKDEWVTCFIVINALESLLKYIKTEEVQ